MSTASNSLVRSFKKKSIANGISQKTLEEVSENEYGSKGAYVIDFYLGIEDVVKCIEEEYDRELSELADISEIKSITQKVRQYLISRIKKDDDDYLFRKELMRYYHTTSGALIFLKNSWKTADYIWNLVGDKSLDLNYYTKRALLSYIYTNSKNFYSEKEDIDFTKTTAFIDKNLDRIKFFNKLKQKFNPDNLPFFRLFR